jgi:hypothetical protein
VSDPLIYTDETLARALEMSPRTLRRERQHGKILDPLPGQNRPPRWSAGEVRRWIDAGMPDAATWRAMTGRAVPAAAR